MAWPSLGLHMHSQSPSGQPSPCRAYDKVFRSVSRPQHDAGPRAAPRADVTISMSQDSECCWPCQPGKEVAAPDPPAWLPLT
jgi:hypothetical protein